MIIRRSANSAIFYRASAVAAIMMTWQVAAKTARDSYFLTVFDPTKLPAMVGAASVVSVLLALLNGRLLRQFGPLRVIPKAYLLSTALHGVEYMLFGTYPGAIAVLVYLHVVAFGSVLLSGFWAVANEQFDPRHARRRFGRIAGFGTLGGLAGGLMAERISTMISAAALLPFLMILQLAVGIVLMGFSSPRSRPEPGETPPVSVMLSRAPYLFGLAGLILMVSMSAAAVDFLFKSSVVSQLGRGPGLSRFFALFYMASSLVSFVAQTAGSRHWLERFGLGRTVATLPAGLTGASLLALFSPFAYVLTAVRGLELVLRGSLFRSGYELFYTPMPETEKRSVKSVIDIGADRLGDGLGAAAIGLLLWLPPGEAKIGILVFTAALSGAAAWLSFRLDRAYSQVLEKNLAEHAVDLKEIVAEDFTTRSAVLRSGVSSVISDVRSSSVRPIDIAPEDPVVEQLSILRRRDSRGINTLLRQMEQTDPLLVPQLIQLLGRDSVYKQVYTALTKCTAPIDGQLMDTLLDQEQDLTIRRRVARLLGSSNSRQAWDGLFRSLEDPSFDIRSRCARSLDAILQRRPEFRPDPAAIFDLVGKELLVAKGAPPEESPTGEPVRVSKATAHILTLLALVLPREAAQTALRALHTDNPGLRALAVEYLESAVPRELREPLCAHIECGYQPSAEVQPDVSMANLIRQTPAIEEKLERMHGLQPSPKSDSLSQEA